MRVESPRRGPDVSARWPGPSQGSRAPRRVIQGIDGSAAATTTAIGLALTPGSLVRTVMIAEAGRGCLDDDSEEWAAELPLMRECELADLRTRLQG